MTSIGIQTFKNCYNLKYLTIPQSVKKIENPASILLEEYRKDLVICGVKGSCAEEFAKKYGITFMDGTAPIATSAATPTVTSKPADKGTILTVSKEKYKVTASSGKNLTVTYQQTTNTKASNITIPATIKSDGITYKVTAIADGAFKENKKLTKVTIEKNVKTVGKNAFMNCKVLKNIVVKTTNLKTVGKNALKGTNKKLVIKVPAKKLSAYKKCFKGKGNTKVKVKKS